MKTSQVLDNWKVCLADDSEVLERCLAGNSAQEKWYSAETNLSVQEALLKAGELPSEILEGKTEAAEWVGKSNWLYSCTFKCENKKHQYLNFKGLDTVATIYLNGNILAECDDMFYPHRYDVSGKLKGENTLHILFVAPEKAMEQVRKTFPMEWRDKIETYTMLRKSPLDYLDCGRVVYVKIGLFEDVCLESFDTAELGDVDVETSLGEWYQKGYVNVKASLNGESCNAKLSIILKDPDGVEVTNGTISFNCGNRTEISLSINAPKLWWPRNYGEHPLYHLSILLLDKNGNQLDFTEKTIGFCRIEKTGDMRFRVNGKEIKLWGGNFAPFYGPTHNWKRQLEQVRFQMDRAVDLNMNCIRLWGGGDAYGDELYEIADQQGILIWQEFFLWWGYYPETPHYRENYRLEAEYHVKRLKHHPCILLWCAGNEILMCNEESHWKQDKMDLSYVIFREDYASVCKRLDPNRIYLPTAPSGGEYPNDPREGDCHPLYYTYHHAVTDFPVFPSEMAHSSIGPLRSLQRFMDEKEIWPDGYINQLTVHAHHHFLKQYQESTQPYFIAKWKRIPLPETWWKHCNNYFASESGPMEQFFDAENAEELVYRINAAFAAYTKLHTERARYGKPWFDIDGNRRTQGYLLWKINDTWPQFYCTLVDYFGEVDIPYYQVKRSFSPLLLSFDFDDHIYLLGVNDTIMNVEGKITIRAFSPGRNRIRAEMSIPVRIKSGESKLLCDLDELCPIATEEVLYASLTNDNGNLLTSTTSLMDIERNLTFPEAILTLSIDQGELVVETDRYAHCVELTGDDHGDSFGWNFSDNFFNLFPFEKKRITIRTDHKEGVIFAKAHYSPHVTRLATQGLSFKPLRKGT